MSSILEKAWKEAFGELSEEEVGSTAVARTVVSSSSATCPASKESSSHRSRVRAVTSVIAPHICGTPLDSERLEPKTHPKRPPRSKPLTQITSTSTQSSSTHAPNSCTSTQTSSTHAPDSFTLDQSLSYVLESFDSLIGPQLPAPPNSTASSMALRRCLYRKQFNLEAFKHLTSLKDPITSVEQLVPVINSSCVKCGIVLV